jgi:hypothetical protein
MKKKTAAQNNKTLVTITRTLYTVGVTSAMLLNPVHCPRCRQPHPIINSDIRPALWKDEQKRHAEEMATRVLREVVHPTIRVYEKALLKYAHHAPECDTWREDKDDACNCGLDELKRTIKANLILQEEE